MEEINKNQSVVEIGMGKPLMKGAGPLAAISRIFAINSQILAE